MSKTARVFTSGRIGFNGPPPLFLCPREIMSCHQLTLKLKRFGFFFEKVCFFSKKSEIFQVLLSGLQQLASCGPAPKTQASFVSFFLPQNFLREFRETFPEEFCHFDGRSGLPSLCYFCYDISSFAKTIV